MTDTYAAWFAAPPAAATDAQAEQAAEEAADVAVEDSDDDDDVGAGQSTTLGGDYLGAPIHGWPDSRPWMRDGTPPALGGAGAIGRADIVFQHIETTYHIDRQRNVPILCLYGCTAEGASVLAWTDTFEPYFYARIADADEAARVRDALEDMFMRTDNAAVNRRKERFVRAMEAAEEAGDDPSDDDDRDGAPGFQPPGTTAHGYRFVKRMEPVDKRSMNGWHRGRPLERMYRIVMAHPTHVKTARDSLEYANPSITARRIETFEANVPFELRFMVDTRLAGCQWLRLPAAAAGSYSHSTKLHAGSAQIQVHIDHTKLQPVPLAEKGDLAPMRFLSFDIEAKRKRRGFCRGEEDPCVCICAALYVIGAGTVHRVVFLYCDTPGGSCAVVHDADHVFVYGNEVDMLLAFAQYVREADPDAFTGWNISGFDWPYLVKRATALGIYAEFLRFTRRDDKAAWLRQQTFQSKAYGAKTTNELCCEGRFTFDALIFMLRGQMTKYRSYKLNAIAKELLGDSKVDVDYTQIPVLHERSDESRAHLCYYCLKDALLPLRILENRMAVVNAVEQARATGVPLKWLLERGQGIKTHSCILRYKEPWEVMPSRSPKENTLFTAGGYVRKPIAGHYRYPLATLDYSSLYPSIMQAHNVCFSTFEWLSWARVHLQHEDYWVPPTEPGEDPVDYCFVKKHIRVGVLPRLLTDLLGQRAYVKGLIKKCDKVKDKVLLDVLDGRQLAIKVVNNSVYGFSKGFILSNMRIMDAVTRWGRAMIKTSASLVERQYRQHSIVDRLACERMGLDFERAPADPGAVDPRPRRNYDARIIYGDSVTADTPVLVRVRGGPAQYVAIEGFFHYRALVTDPDGKQHFCPYYETEVWSDQGWTRIERFIRHHTTKHIYRVTTGAGWVDVTSDHSLLRPDGSVVRPSTACVEEPLLHAAFPADVLAAADDTSSSDSNMADYGEHIAYSLPEQMNPWWTTYSARQVRCMLAAFHGATLKGDASDMTPCFRAAIRLLEDAANPQPFTADDEAHKIISIQDLGPCPQDAYVYDLQTHNHHFAAGVGKLVVHNTDSIMIDFGDAPIQDIARYARDAAALCTAAMEPPNSLAWESLKLRSLYFRPKMYCSLEISAPDLTPNMSFADAVARAKVSYKGLQSKRRDNAPIGGETQQAVLKLVLKQDNVAGAVAVVKDTIRDLLRNRTDMSRLVITKGLSKTDAQYEEGGTKQQHTELKKRISARARWTGEIVPETGDRVSFVMRAGNEKDKACDLSEDPLYAMQHGIPLNIKYYIKKQIMAATLSVFTCIWEPQQLTLISTSMSDKKLRTLRAYKELFAPSQPHMLDYVQAKAGNYGIASHATVLPSCAQPGCKVRLHGGERSAVVCDAHVRDVARAALEADCAQARATNSAAWTRCRECAGSGFDEQHCTNSICDNFFHRRKTAAEVADIEDILGRFDAPEKEQALTSAEAPPRRRIIDRVAEAGGEEAWRAQRAERMKKRGGGGGWKKRK